MNLQINPRPVFFRSPGRFRIHASGDVYDSVIVGGGISGLCTARALAAEHKDVVKKILLTEARDRVGGNITTMKNGEYLWEDGPNSFTPSDPMLKMAVREGLRWICCVLGS